ncbi:DUF4129 domain-containing protein [Leifsonia shinshuensis]|uniref:DUF4129 domain-containing protein n=1 Tax=Leifsonia shinshuensis TaxID=150026 RepID=UPI001F5052EB|nr:DUF4129 domain-containing protein [Leifsonia shinshuensis]
MLLPSALRLDVPVDPSSPQAQDWLRNELAKPEYQAAKPTWFDLASKAVQDWLGSLFSGPSGDAGPVLLLVVVVVVAALIVAAFLIFGRPRINRRAASDRRALFGADDGRSADELRRSAAEAARAADWPLAIEEQFRAIAAALDERTLVDVRPGTTATEFAAQAARSAPDQAAELRQAARTFDEVRYLDRPGSEAGYQQLVALDTQLQRIRPAQEAVVA